MENHYMLRMQFSCRGTGAESAVSNLEDGFRNSAALPAK